MIKATVKFTDKSKEIASRSAVMSDLMMGLMASGIEIQLKTSGKTPFQHGGLRSHARAVKIAAGHYEVTDDQEYAAAQEAGTVRGHAITHYTTPGTGKGFFRDAIETVKARGDDYARTAASAAGLRSF